MKRTMSRRFRPTGFSLLELLVAVAVIALLAALLVPFTRGVFQTSHAAACASNLRTLGSALHLYIAENNGRFPPSRRRLGPNSANSEGSAIGQHHWIYSAYYGRSPTPSSEGQRPIEYFSDPEPTSVEMNKSGRQYRDAGVFWCPADNDPTLRPLRFAPHSYADNAYYIGGETAYSTHAKTGMPKGNNDYTPSHGRLAAVRRPSQIIYAIDHVNPGHTMRQTPITQQSWPLAPGTESKVLPDENTTRVAFERHGGKANALFLDGSVRALVFEDLAGTQLKHLNPALQ